MKTIKALINKPLFAVLAVCGLSAVNFDAKAERITVNCKAAFEVMLDSKGDVIRGSGQEVYGKAFLMLDKDTGEASLRTHKVVNFNMALFSEKSKMWQGFAPYGFSGQLVQEVLYYEPKEDQKPMIWLYDIDQTKIKSYIHCKVEGIE